MRRIPDATTTEYATPTNGAVDYLRSAIEAVAWINKCLDKKAAIGEGD